MIRNASSCLAVISITLLAFGLAQNPPPMDGDTTRPKPGQRSLVIVFDTTGSMGNELEQVRTEAKALVEYAANQPENPFYNFIFVDFNDPSVGTALVTTNKTILLEKLQKITVYAGGDCPELSMEGIKRALEKTLYNSQIFVFTDAPAKDTYLENTVTKLIQEQQAMVTFFITQGCGIPKNGNPLYNRLAEVSGGVVYRLTEFDISKVMKVVRETLNINRDQVYVEDFFQAKQETHVVPTNTTDLTVTVTGSNARVKFTDPDNQVVNMTPRINLENVQIYQQINPKSGPWIIDVQVDKAGRLGFTEVSSLSFKFGFSVTMPRTIKETFVRPLQGIENYLVVAPHNTPDGFKFTHVTITEGKTSKRYDLREQSPDLFITDKFVQPGQFKVTIHGIDRNGNLIKRLISTSIQPELESEPTIMIIEDELTALQYGEIFISCTAKSFSPMNLSLIKDGFVLKEIVANQSYELEHTIPMATLNDRGKYVCRASNRRGQTEKTISVAITPRPQPLPLVRVYPESKNVQETGDIRIQCKIKYPYDSTYWKYERKSSVGSELQNNEIRLDSSSVLDGTLVLTSVTTNHAGTYICVAKVNETEVKDSVYIAVGHQASLTDSAEDSLVASSGDSEELTCYAEGLPEPMFKWFFKPFVGMRMKLSYDKDTLTIENLNFTHDGHYECEVYNGIGEIQRRIIELKVKALEVPVLKEPTENPIVAQTGEVRKISCECEQCRPIRSSIWTFNDVRINETTLNNVQVDNSSSNTDHFKTTLTVNGVRSVNEGVYKCELENDQNSASQEVVLNILQKPKIKQISVSNSQIGSDGEIIIRENQSSELDCQLKADVRPVFEWFKNEVYFSNGPSLKMVAATYNDSGSYRCTAANTEGSDSKTVQVQVHGQPRILDGIPEKMVKLNGKELVVECKAAGHPVPKVRWEYDDGQVVDTTNGVLKLEDHINVYSTFFTCHAENSIGSAKRTTTMRYQQNILTTVSNGFQLLCRPYVTGKVDWYKDNVKIEPSAMYIISKSIISPTNLNAYNYTGAYRCETGGKQFHFSVTIATPPTIEAVEATVDGVTTTLANDEIAVRVGQEVTLRCLTNGNPAPQVYWRTRRRSLEGGSTLHLASVEKKHGRLYTCFAELQGIGEEKKQIRLSVLAGTDV